MASAGRKNRLRTYIIWYFVFLHYINDVHAKSLSVKSISTFSLFFMPYLSGNIRVLLGSTFFGYALFHSTNSFLFLLQDNRNPKKTPEKHMAAAKKGLTFKRKKLILLLIQQGRCEETRSTLVSFYGTTDY